MPRPSPADRRKIEARRREKQAMRDSAAERERRTADRVQKILDEALSRPRSRETLPDLHNLIEKLESAYDLAMATNQAKAATDAVMAMGRLLGLVIDKSQSALAIGSPDDFRKTEAQVIEEMRERFGDRETEKFLQAIDVAREAYRAFEAGDDTIEIKLDRFNGITDGGD